MSTIQEIGKILEEKFNFRFEQHPTDEGYFDMFYSSEKIELIDELKLIGQFNININSDLVKDFDEKDLHEYSEFVTNYLVFISYLCIVSVEKDKTDVFLNQTDTFLQTFDNTKFFPIRCYVDIMQHFSHFDDKCKYIEPILKFSNQLTSEIPEFCTTFLKHYYEFCKQLVIINPYLPSDYFDIPKDMMFTEKKPFKQTIIFNNDSKES